MYKHLSGIRQSTSLLKEQQLSRGLLLNSRILQTLTVPCEQVISLRNGYIAEAVHL